MLDHGQGTPAPRRPPRLQSAPAERRADRRVSPGTPRIMNAGWPEQLAVAVRQLEHRYATGLVQWPMGTGFLSDCSDGLHGGSVRPTSRLGGGCASWP